MLNYIWAFIIIISIISSIVTNRVQEVSNSIINSASDGISLVISILGMMALWTGLMKIAETSDLTNILSKLFSPITKFLFPELLNNKLNKINNKNNSLKYICMNIIANILGLGNAATPFGIKSMQELQKLNNNKKTATNSMIMFVVINTASIQIIPTFLSILRQKYNSQNIFEILPHIWITSIIALISGIIITKIFERISKNYEQYKKF